MNIHPIATLYDRLVSTFENSGELANARLKSYKDGQLSRYIRIETSNFKTPFSDQQTNEIVLNQRFLCMIWCITYIIMDVTENKSRTAINITETFSVLDKKDIGVKLLDELFDWALELKNENSSEEWPVHLPMPTLTDHNVRVANIIFLDVISYIMFHEVAHIVNGHRNSYKEIYIKLKKGGKLNEEEKSLCVQMEQEADHYAYDCLVGSQTDEATRYHKHLGIILAGLCSTFTLKPGMTLTSMTHPSIHVRIFNLRNMASFSEGGEFHLSRVMNVGLSMFCKLQDIPYGDKHFNSFNEILDYFFNLLDSRKNQILLH